MKNERCMYSKAWGLTGAILLLLTLILAGCPKEIFVVNQVEFAEDLGSVQVTLYRPYLYDKYAEQLQPTFKLSEEQAMEKVLPKTKSERAYKGRSTKASAEVALPTKAFEKITDTATVNTGEKTTNKTEKETEKSGDTKTVDLGEPTGFRVDPPEIDVELKDDPNLVYSNAKSLYQAVKLINHQYESFDYGKDYVTYIANLQITPMPTLRHAPYDAVIDVDFQLQNNNKAGIGNPVVIPLLVNDSLEQRSAQLTTEQLRDLSMSISGIVGGAGFGGGISDAVKLISMTVGKDYNALLTVGRIGQSTLRIRVGAMQQAGAGYAMISRPYMVTVVLVVKNQDLNLNNNQGEVVGTVTRTSVVKIVDALTGAVLPSKYDGKNGITRRKNYDIIVGDYGFKPLSEDSYYGVMSAILSKDRSLFVKKLYGFAKGTELPEIFGGFLNLPKESVALIDRANIKSLTSINISDPDDKNITKDMYAYQLNALWLKLIVSQSDSGIDMNTEDLPSPLYKPLCIKKAQSVNPQGESKAVQCADTFPICSGQNMWICETEALTVLDDGTAATVKLSPIGNSRNQNVNAKLFANVDGKEISFTSTKATSSQNEITFTFESLASWGVKKIIKLDLLDIPDFRKQSGDMSWKDYSFETVKYIVKDGNLKSELKFVNQNGNEYIMLKDADTISDVYFEIHGPIDSNTRTSLVVENARIKSKSPTALFQDFKGEKGVIRNVITGTGPIKLKLENLVSGEKVKIYGLGIDGSRTNELIYQVKVNSTSK